MAPYSDRREAGRALASRLIGHAGLEGAVILALPRGGVPVAWEVARALGAPLDIVPVRKLGVPGHEELAMGAIADRHTVVLNEEIAALSLVDAQAVARVAAAEWVELRRREVLYRGDRPAITVEGRAVVLVDDGLATGATMRAAAAAVAGRGAARIVVAVPVAPVEACDDLRAVVDEVVCLASPSPFRAVGAWYSDFGPTSDVEVRRLLDAAAARAEGGGG